MGAFPSPSPSLGDIPSVRCMGWCGRRARCMCWHPDPAFPGISPALPPPTGAGEERRRRGWGGGDRRAVYGEMPVEREIRVASPGLRPSWDLATRTPAPAREPCGRGNVVLPGGEGRSPPRAPPRVISPRSGVWGGVGGGQCMCRHPEPAFPGISPALPPPTGAGEERRRRGWGGGDRRAVYGEMPVEREIRVAFPRVCAPPGILPREPPLLRGSPVGGAMWFYLAGRGVPHMR